jgi:hypothetical protein
MRASMVRSSLLAVIVGLFISTWAQAGPLANDQAEFGAITSGSTPFDNGGTLKGFVDWAVYNPGAFPYAGYTATSGELSYAYQIFVTGAAPVSSFELVLTDPADNIGNFALAGGMAPSSQTLTSMTSAKWTFGGIPSGGNSNGLSFSSPRLPQSLFATVVDTGQSTWVIPLPSPGPNGIPEPATLSLAAMGSLMLGLRRRR